MSHPPWLDQVLAGAGWSTFWASAAGRLLFHTTMVRRGVRRFWSRDLIWELPVALGMGFVGDGLAEYLGEAGATRTGLIVTISYLGPRVLETAFAILARDHTPRE